VTQSLKQSIFAVLYSHSLCVSHDVQKETLCCIKKEVLRSRNVKKQCVTVEKNTSKENNVFCERHIWCDGVSLTQKIQFKKKKVFPVDTLLFTLKHTSVNNSHLLSTLIKEHGYTWTRPFPRVVLESGSQVTVHVEPKQDI